MERRLLYPKPPFEPGSVVEFEGRRCRVVSCDPTDEPGAWDVTFEEVEKACA